MSKLEASFHMPDVINPGRHFMLRTAETNSFSIPEILNCRYSKLDKPGFALGQISDLICDYNSHKCSSICGLWNSKCVGEKSYV